MIGHGAIMNICRLAFRDLFALNDVFFLERIDLVINMFFRERPGVQGKKFIVALDFKHVDSKHSPSY